jgi:uncharacterized protein
MMKVDCPATVAHHEPSWEHDAAARSGVTRRMSLWKSALVLGGLAAAGGSLQALMAQPANGQRWDPGYGPLFPTLDKNTGLPLLLLPKGFIYESFGRTGDPLSDGTPTPRAHDGMAVVRSSDDFICIPELQQSQGRRRPWLS